MYSMHKLKETFFTWLYTPEDKNFLSDTEAALMEERLRAKLRRIDEANGDYMGQGYSSGCFDVSCSKTHVKITIQFSHDIATRFRAALNLERFDQIKKELSEQGEEIHIITLSRQQFNAAPLPTLEELGIDPSSYTAPTPGF